MLFLCGADWKPQDLAINDFNCLQEKLISSDRLLYFADNAGEVVFDRIFIEEMLRERETLYILFADGKMSCNSK